MKVTRQINLPVGEISAMRTLDNGTHEILLKEEVNVKDVSKKTNTEKNEKTSRSVRSPVLIEVSKLSLKDPFMQYMPESTQERLVKGMVFEVIARGIKDFYKPVCDPSLTKDGEHIFYEFGNLPAVEKSYDWWEKVAKNFCPERSSRLGTRLEYFGFLGVLLKNMVLDGWDVKDAWEAVCVDSRGIGGYLNTPRTIFGLEPTGSREVCGFYDLANTHKILAEDGDGSGCWVFGGSHRSKSYRNPLAEELYFSYHTKFNPNAVGWIVFEK